MAANWCAIKRMLQPENRFSATTSRMYFLRGGDTAQSESGLVQQTVQIVASHDLTLVIGLLWIAHVIVTPAIGMVEKVSFL